VGLKKTPSCKTLGLLPPRFIGSVHRVPEMYKSW